MSEKAPSPELLRQKENYTLIKRVDQEVTPHTRYSCNWGDDFFKQAEDYISWDPNEQPEIHSFDYDNKTYYLINSTPCYCSSDDKTPLRTDLVVVAKTPVVATLIYDEAVEYGDKQREKRVKRILPLIKQLEQDERIKLILGRGTAYDQRRVYNHGDDVDVILFIDWENEKGLNEALKTIEEKSKELGKKGNIEIRAMSFSNQKDRWFFSTHLEPDFYLNLDFIPYEFILKAQKNKKFALAQLGDNYMQDMLTHTEFLGGSNKARKTLLEIVQSVGKHKSKK